MSRPRNPIGGHGEIAFIARGKGKVEAAHALPRPRSRCSDKLKFEPVGDQ